MKVECPECGHKFNVLVLSEPMIELWNDEDNDIWDHLDEYESIDLFLLNNEDISQEDREKILDEM